MKGRDDGKLQVPEELFLPCTVVPKRQQEPVWRHWNIRFWKVGLRPYQGLISN